MLVVLEFSPLFSMISNCLDSTYYKTMTERRVVHYIYIQHFTFGFLSTDTSLHREKDFRCCTLRDLERVSRKNTPFPYMQSPVQLYSEPSQSFSRNLAFPPSIRDQIHYIIVIITYLLHSCTSDMCACMHVGARR